ncbi:MAG: putative RecB family exonuclease [Gammaproteobacteria bacterium]|nr:MAG: putative RecB family exonuclease [Gammaproteobacteria bacterium]TND03213.1 MAG: putative RecB family exonuclease [Gammaproteobacteria bacterium]
MAQQEADDPIMISALQHYSYCPRQCALIHVEQVFSENVYTLRGRAVHERVDEPDSQLEDGVRVERALPLFCARLGLAGKADVVEFHAGDVPYPVEYKHGPRRSKEHDDLQLAAQAMCLEEMTGKKVTHGAIYHHSSRRRREVEITDELRKKVEETVMAVRALLKSGVLPPPVNDERCRHCSLSEICQPQTLGKVGKIHVLRSKLFDPDAAL